MSHSPPLCETCPLQRVGADDGTKTQLRDRAVELQYGYEFVEPWEISGTLSNEFEVDQTIADAAAECLGKIYRNYCRTCTIGFTAIKVDLLPRPPLE